MAVAVCSAWFLLGLGLAALTLGDEEDDDVYGALKPYQRYFYLAWVILLWPVSLLVKLRRFIRRPNRWNNDLD
jgi:hypothetical protein